MNKIVAVNRIVHAIAGTILFTGDYSVHRRLSTDKPVYNFIHGRCLFRCHRALCSTHFWVTCNKKKDREIALSFNSMLSQTGKWINVCIKARFQLCVGVSARAWLIMSGHL